MKVLRKIIKAIATAIANRDVPEIGTLDYTTGKVKWS